MTGQTLHWAKTINQLSIQPSQERANWLTKPTILSQALRRLCQSLLVNVISQEFAIAFDDEYKILHLDKKALPLIRKVLMEGDHRPLTYGRVIIPPTTYQHYFSQFDALGASPIGETLLHYDSEVTRDPFEFAVLDESSLLFQEVQQKYLLGAIEPPLFGRRSVFWMKQDPLLVTELFLPTLPPYCP